VKQSEKRAKSTIDYNRHAYGKTINGFYNEKIKDMHTRASSKEKEAKKLEEKEAKLLKKLMETQ